jgi:ribonucleoside-diphosphate reductase beta chain
MAAQDTIEELRGIQAMSISELAGVPIATLLAELDAKPPAYRSLYYRWERQQWEAGGIDLERDASDWTHRLFPEQRRAVLWLLSGSTAGEKQLARTLVAFVDAATTEEQGVFLTTQLADAGRNTVLYQRIGEAVGEDVFALDVAWGPGGEISSGRALLRVISDVSEILRLDRDASVELIKGVTAQHLLLQGVTALTARRALLEWLQKQDAMPGLVTGLMAATRDEVRHVQFGLRFLAEEAASGEGRAAIEATLETAAPKALSILESGEMDLEAIELGAKDLRTQGAETLAKRLEQVGIPWTPPEPNSRP